MLEVDSWIDLLYEGTTWKWSGSQQVINASDYKWYSKVQLYLCYIRYKYI